MISKYISKKIPQVSTLRSGTDLKPTGTQKHGIQGNTGGDQTKHPPPEKNPTSPDKTPEPPAKSMQTDGEINDLSDFFLSLTMLK